MSVTGKPAQIYDALMTRALALSTGLPISVPEPDAIFDPPADGKYIEVTYFPNRPAWQGVASGKQDQGLLQVTVVWPKNEGLVAPLQVVDAVLAHFAKTTAMFSGSTKVTVSAEPWAAQPLIEDADVRIPITIPWTA